MVRVLSVYHFPAQQTKIVDDTVDSCIIPDSRLVLAKRSGLLDIYDLQDLSSEPISSFAAIEDVLCVRHCVQGNYLACLEQNPTKANKRSVRVYCNFQREAGGLGGEEGIKVRIAGKVTPVYSTAESTGCLEMLEIPLRQPADLIACCQVRRAQL